MLDRIIKVPPAVQTAEKLQQEWTATQNRSRHLRKFNSPARTLKPQPATPKQDKNESGIQSSPYMFKGPQSNSKVGTGLVSHALLSSRAD